MIKSKIHKRIEILIRQKNPLGSWFTRAGKNRRSTKRPAKALIGFFANNRESGGAWTAVRSLLDRHDPHPMRLKFMACTNLCQLPQVTWDVNYTLLSLLTEDSLDVSASSFSSFFFFLHLEKKELWFQSSVRSVTIKLIHCSNSSLFLSLCFGTSLSSILPSRDFFSFFRNQ